MLYGNSWIREREREKVCFLETDYCEETTNRLVPTSCFKNNNKPNQTEPKQQQQLPYFDNYKPKTYPEKTPNKHAHFLPPKLVIQHWTVDINKL